jgi:hypothetical protein
MVKGGIDMGYGIGGVGCNDNCFIIFLVLILLLCGMSGYGGGCYDKK